MKKINVFVWIGLSINIIMGVFLWYVSSMPQEYYDGLSYSERNLIEIMSVMIVPWFICVLMQIASVFVLFKSTTMSLTLAIVGSIIMLPTSCIFLTGYVFSYETERNKKLPVFSIEKTPSNEAALYFNVSYIIMLKLVMAGYCYHVWVSDRLVACCFRGYRLDYDIPLKGSYCHWRDTR